MTIRRLRVKWSGFAGSPGVNTLYFAAGVDPTTDVHTMYAASTALWPTSVHIDVDPGGDEIDETTGAISGAWTGTTTAQVVGSAGTVYAAPAGLVIEWRTATIRNGRRVLGKTFWVPLTIGAYDSNGNLTGTLAANATSAVNAFLGSTGGAALRVWARPKTGVLGLAAPVISGFVPDFTAVLRSRRD